MRKIIEKIERTIDAINSHELRKNSKALEGGHEMVLKNYIFNLKKNS